MRESTHRTGSLRIIRGFPEKQKDFIELLADGKWFASYLMSDIKVI
jgi:hypothetical protein